VAPSSKFVLTVEGGLTDQEVSDLRYLFADALREFAEARANPAAYVRSRYPNEKELYAYDGKLAQVERRVDLARKLHHAAMSFHCEDLK